MPTFVALLRGVNVGKARRVPMVALRDTLTRLGYTGVATVLNSGNAVFRAAHGTPARHASDIAAAISDKLHIEVPVIVKSASEMAVIVSENPLLDGCAEPFAPAGCVRTGLKGACRVLQQSSRTWFLPSVSRSAGRLPICCAPTAYLEARPGSAAREDRPGSHDEELGDRAQTAGALKRA